MASPRSRLAASTRLPSAALAAASTWSQQALQQAALPDPLSEARSAASPLDNEYGIQDARLDAVSHNAGSGSGRGGGGGLQFARNEPPGQSAATPAGTGQSAATPGGSGGGALPTPGGSGGGALPPPGGSGGGALPPGVGGALGTGSALKRPATDQKDRNTEINEF